jgi:hypothetical protein
VWSSTHELYEFAFAHQTVLTRALFHHSIQVVIVEHLLQRPVGDVAEYPIVGRAVRIT